MTKPTVSKHGIWIKKLCKFHSQCNAKFCLGLSLFLNLIPNVSLGKSEVALHVDYPVVCCFCGEPKSGFYCTHLRV